MIETFQRPKCLSKNDQNVSAKEKTASSYAEKTTLVLSEQHHGTLIQHIHYQLKGAVLRGN